MAFTWQNMATAIILTVILVLPITSGLYFHIAETERKCFIEEIPDETMVTGKLLQVYRKKLKQKLMNLLQAIIRFNCTIQGPTDLLRKAKASECT